jgi:periplasmic copper chaperone A
MKQLLIALVVAASLLASARAQTPISPEVVVESAWARATPGGARTGAVYLTLVARGTDGDRLIGIATPVADQAQLHVESIENGIMKMRPVAGVEVKPGAAAVLKPGAIHVMLIGLKQPLKEGETFPLTLDFAKAGKQEAQVQVVKAGAMGMPGMGATGLHDMSHMEMMKH